MRFRAFLAAAVLLLASCASTDVFVSPQALSGEIPLEEKLEVAGAASVEVPMPEIFLDGTDWLQEMESLFRNAEDYILITTFLGSDAPRLRPLYRALMDAAERGVRVYFVMDGISSYDMTESKNYMTPLYYLRSSGVHLEEYNPVTAMHLINPATIVYRDHSKLLVVDGEMAAVGGMNMNYISMGAGEGRTQRDSMYLFRSPSLASALVDEFVSIWNEVSVEKISAADFPVPPSDDEGYDAWLVTTEGIASMYASLFGSAEESVVIFPYLPALDKNMKAGVRNAVDRGVEVTMTIPVDLRGYAASGIYHALPDLIESTGADIFLSVYGEDGELLPLLHEKLMIVDSRYVVIGSANFNFRSMTLSEELALVIDSPELAAAVGSHASGITAAAEHVTYDDAVRLKKEGGSVFAYLFTYFGG